MRKALTPAAMLAAIALVFTGALPAVAAVEPPELVETFADGTNGLFGSYEVDGDVYFIRDAGAEEELWWTDGTDAHLVRSLQWIQEIRELGGVAYVSVTDPDDTDSGLWTATQSGATRVAEFDYVEELTEIGGVLYFSAGRGADHGLWSWDGTENFLATFDAQSIDSIEGADGHVVFYAQRPGQEGIYSWNGSTIDGYTHLFPPEDSLALADSVVYVAYDGDNAGIWTWDATDELQFRTGVDSNADLSRHGEVAVVSGVSGSRDGLWTWDGSNVTELGPDFLYPPAEVISFGDLMMFYGAGDDGTGLWTWDGTDVEFFAAFDEVYNSAVFGDTVILSTYGSPESVWEWDGVSAPELVSDDFEIVDQLRATDDYVLLFVRADGFQNSLWSLEAGPEVTTLEISPQNQVVVAGVAQDFTIEAFDEEGLSIGDYTASASFSTEDGAADVVDNGITFYTAGTHEVTAEVGLVTVSTNVTVLPAVLDYITISPANGSLVAGDSLPFQVTGYDEYNNSRGNVTGLTTFTADPLGPSVGGNVVTFPEAGSFTVNASHEGKSASAHVEVGVGTLTTIELELSATSVNQGGSVTGTVTGFNENGVSLGDHTGEASFTSDHPSDDIDGNEITFPTASPHEITATIGELADSVVVEVIPAAPTMPATGFEGEWLAGLAVLLLAVGGVALVARKAS